MIVNHLMDVNRVHNMEQIMYDEWNKKINNLYHIHHRILFFVSHNLSLNIVELESMYHLFYSYLDYHLCSLIFPCIYLISLFLVVFPRIPLISRQETLFFFLKYLHFKHVMLIQYYISLLKCGCFTRFRIIIIRYNISIILSL